jgi:hypothetical protein
MTFDLESTQSEDDIKYRVDGVWNIREKCASDEWENITDEL